MTITAFHTKHSKAQQLIQLCLHKMYEWATTNNLHINTDKTNTTLILDDIHSSEQTFPHHMHTKLVQPRANKLPLFQSYLHTVNLET